MEPQEKRPNILLIVPDQMRGDCLGIDGHPSLLTPNMDEVAAQGTHFRRAYTTCASCIPARRSLLTGQYPATNGMVGFQGGCPIESPVLPQLLSEAGYHTAITGRYMHQHPYEEDYGYQTRDLGSTYVDDDDYADDLALTAPQTDGIQGHGISYNGWTAKPWHLAEHMHPTNWVVRRAKDVIERHQEGAPLFLTASFYAPHPPLIPPEFYLNRYLRVNCPRPSVGDWVEMPPHEGRGVGIDAHRTVLRGEALRSAQAGYYGLINHIDDQIYWLMRAFQSASRRDGRPWVVVITSDHGEMLGDHHYFRKCEPYEGSARIPLLIQGSGDLDFASRQSVNRPVCLEDIMPTLLELADIECPPSVDGESLVGCLRGERDVQREVLHTEHSPCYSPQQAYHMMTDGRLKYIWRPVDGTEQLFDVQNDPKERYDLSERVDRQEVVREWRDRLIQRLEGRPEGFTDGERLIPGRSYEAVLPHAQSQG